MKAVKVKNHCWNTFCPVLTRNGKEIKPPVSFFDLNMDDDDCRAFGRTMVRALEEQVDTVAKEALITRAMDEALTMREWNIVKNSCESTTIQNTGYETG